MENNLESQVIFHSFNNQITDYYHAIDGLINATNSETVGMTTIEALAFGLPVIGSNSGGTKEILENGKYGLLFEPNNESDLAQKINNILSEKMTFKAELLIQKAEQFSHHFVCELVEKELVLISTHLKKKF
ncbi:MAG: glycosyltransferase family 4 protein [Flavobacteriia bacterium]|nr:glycosyltransferase family 4 protein [Flavobacteriia bacterium]